MAINEQTQDRTAMPQSPTASPHAARAVPPALVASIGAVARLRLLQVSEEALLTDVAKRLSTSRTGLAVVCDAAGAVIGVVTESLLVAQFGLGRSEIFGARAGQTMHRDFTTCVASDSLSEVLTKMHRQGLVHVVILEDGGKPAGVLHARDGLRALLAAGDYEEELLRNYVTGVGYQ